MYCTFCTNEIPFSKMPNNYLKTLFMQQNLILPRKVHLLKQSPKKAKGNDEMLLPNQIFDDNVMTTIALKSSANLIQASMAFTYYISIYLHFLHIMMI